MVHNFTHWNWFYDIAWKNVFFLKKKFRSCVIIDFFYVLQASLFRRRKAPNCFPNILKFRPTHIILMPVKIWLIPLRGVFLFFLIWVSICLYYMVRICALQEREDWHLNCGLEFQNGANPIPVPSSGSWNLLLKKNVVLVVFILVSSSFCGTERRGRIPRRNCRRGISGRSWKSVSADTFPRRISPMLVSREFLNLFSLFSVLVS